MVEFQDRTFVYWASRREEARKAKEAGLPRDQWSADPIMRNYRFCNVSREDDIGTKMVDKFIRKPMVEAGAAPDEIFRAICIGRFFNLPATLEQLFDYGAIGGRKTNLELVHKICADRMRNGLPTFSTAYVVGCPPGQTRPPFEGEKKVSYVCSIVHRAQFPAFAMGSRRAFVHELSKEAGFKQFMAGQVAADLAYTPLMADASDHMTWAPFGPGALRGMNLSLGRPIDAPMKEDEYLRTGIAQLEALPEDIVWDRRLTLHDVASNVNCETSKYIRISCGGAGRKYK